MEPVIIETTLVTSGNKDHALARRKEAAMSAAIEACREEGLTDEQAVRERIAIAARSVK
jgi:hypothetical protein